jgi:hypothetical protein
VPCGGLIFTYSPLFWGQILEKAFVEFWGSSSSSEFVFLQQQQKD